MLFHFPLHSYIPSGPTVQNSGIDMRDVVVVAASAAAAGCLQCPCDSRSASVPAEEGHRERWSLADSLNMEMKCDLEARRKF